MFILGAKGNNFRMMYVWCLLLLLLLVLLLLYRRQPVVAPMPDLATLAQSFRNYRLYATPLRYPEFGILHRVERQLNAAKRKGQELYSFEQWLRDNAYLLWRTQSNMRASKLHRLPAVAGVPRVLALARFIVSHSDDLGEEKVKFFVDEVQRHAPFGWRELQLLPTALAYAVCEHLTALAKWSKYGRRMKRKAQDEYAHLMQDDVYLYYRYVEGKATIPHGVDIQGVRTRFWSNLQRMDAMAQQYFGMLRQIDDLRPEVLMTMCTANAEMQIDEHISTDTRLCYLSQVAMLGEKFNLAETGVVHVSAHIAATEGCDFATALFDVGAIRRFVRGGKAKLTRGTGKKQIAYIIAVCLLSVGFGLLPLAFGTSLPYIVACPLILVSVFAVVEQMVQWFTIRRVDTDFRMGYTCVPRESATIVVVSRYIDSVERLKEACTHLRQLSGGKKQENLHYCMLIDFPSAAEAWSDNDEKILKQIKAFFREDGLCYAVRARRQEGARYVAWERKRGAILEWFEALQTGDTAAFRYVSYLPEGCTLAVLLDDDSRLLPSGVLDAVNRMLHPANAGYDLMTFDPCYRRADIGTLYALRFAAQVEQGTYPTQGDFYADAFDTALYSGKAIVRIRPYLAALRHRFPEGRVLSHDLIEGAVLTCGRLHQRVYEDVPHSFVADATRLARWQRGDVLLLPYLAGTTMGDNGKVLNHLQPMYKFVIWCNFLRVLRPMCTLLLAYLGVLSGAYALTAYAAVLWLFPHIPSLLHALFSVWRNRLRYVLQDMGYALWRMIDEVVLLPYRAVSGAWIVLQTLFQSLFSRKNLLIWRPFFCTQGKVGILAHIRMFAGAHVLMVLLSLFAWNAYWALYAVLSAAGMYIVCANHTLHLPQLSAVYRREALDILRDTYHYFVDNAPKGLVMDNVQFNPPHTGVDMTSPTDLGMSVLAHAVAVVADLDEAAWQRMQDTLDAILSLERWQGHLYNWYTVDGAVCGRTISTVDSANFMACIMTAKALATERSKPEIVSKCNDLLNATFAPLYDAKHNMLCITLHPDEGRQEGHYDTLASEARLAYFLAVAEGLPCQSYFALARDITPWGGNTLLSWGGTAFEYLLPRVLIAPPIGSLLYHSERMACKRQMRDHVDGLFGISESCVYAFNDQMRYRYRANGVEGLALHPDCGEKVISPYSAGLMCAYYPHESMRNLLALKARGMYGKYGFFEAWQDGKVVQCNMAHHQGMLLAGVTNALFDNVLCRLFMSADRVASAMLMCGESMITQRVPRHQPTRNVAVTCGVRTYAYPYPTRAAHVLKSGIAKGVYMSDGRQELYFDNVLVGGIACEKCFDNERLTLLRWEGEQEIFSPYPEICREDKHVFEVQGGAVLYRNTGRGVYEEIRLSPDGLNEVRDLIVYNDADVSRVVKVGVYFPLSLCDKGGILSHRAYRDLFVNTQIVGDEKCSRGVSARRILDGQPHYDLFCSVQGLDEVHYQTNRMNVGRNYQPKDIFECMSGTFHMEGDVLYPCFTAIGVCTVPAHAETHIYICTGWQQQSAEALADMHRDLHKARALGYYGLAECLSETSHLFDCYGNVAMAERVASVLLDNWDTNACVQMDDNAVKYLAYTDNVRENLTNALTVRLLWGVKDVRMCTPPEDKRGALCAHIAGNIGDGGQVFTPRQNVRWRRIRFAHSIRPHHPPLVLATGEGGYIGAGRYAVQAENTHTMLPYANVVANGQAGFVLTENGGGYLFGENSRQNKWTMWRNDCIRDVPTHLLVATDGKERWRLNDASCCLCVHGPDSTVYTTNIGGNILTVTYRLVGNSVQIAVSQSERKQPLWVYFSFVPLLDWAPNDVCYLKKYSAKSAVIANALTKQKVTFSWSHGTFFGDNEGLDSLLSGERIGLPKRLDAAGALGRSAEILFTLCEGQPDHGEAYTLAQPVGVVGNISLNMLLMGLWRQLVHSRLNGKTSFYQCGGATGFRDQLQDACCLMLSDPDKSRRMLLDFAAHQYAEGDVMHWWHAPRTGVRTHIADDRLFLAESVCRYVHMTDDMSVLQEQVAFLVSDPLPPSMPSRYETPSVGKETASVAEHIRRAVLSALQFGHHDLLLVGGGDWNDGVNAIGQKGKGESVWLSMYAVMVIRQAMDILPDERENLQCALDRLGKGIRRAFRKDRYLAYYTDGGEVLGAGQGDCALYLMTQSFAVLCGVDDRHAALCMQTAKQLVDYDEGTVALFRPPFGRDSHVGYIADYPKGVRENGGQYTHAVAWFIRALIASGEVEYAYEVLNMINPVERCRHKREMRQYRAEPYVVAADVYMAAGYTGQSGWTWYTGSAGWLFRVIAEDFYGVQIQHNLLTISPHLPKALDGTELSITWRGLTYHIFYKHGDGDKLTVDGREVDVLQSKDARGHIVCECRRYER